MGAEMDWYDNTEGPPLYIPVEDIADMVCRFAHPWQDQRDIRATIRSWSGRSMDGEMLEQLAAWERKPARFDRDRPRYVPVALRRAVMERDNGTCQACGSTEDPSLDHIKPFSKGGRHTARNLRVLCQPCNSSRRDRTDEEWRGRDG